LSLAVAILVTTAAFHVISSRSTSRLRLALSGTFMGVGIISMHYTGMTAMREYVGLSYNPLFVALSVVVAMAAATAGLWLAFHTTDLRSRFAAAVVLGLAISGMHYTAMRAAIFTAHSPPSGPHPAVLDQTSLALLIAGATFVMLALAMSAS